MATWVIPHERRKRPPAPKPDPAIGVATDIGYSNIIADTKNDQEALRIATDWVRARRPHIGDNE